MALSSPKGMRSGIEFIIVAILCCNLVHGDLQDPSQIVSQALLCFNNRMIYDSCEQSFRLSEAGTINVPYEKTDEYCNGPCLTETQLVLSCIDGILSNFLFYNKATVGDVRSTILAACGDTDTRGDFNVAEHVQGVEWSGGEKLLHLIACGCLLGVSCQYLLN
ncbi:uncharacterized protein LOC18445099 [Amborella trichopoda]|uniref:DUF7731 domain-containing protein n=1 Tax=Amborella trichopoda TaxID=13333 RepID=U5D2W4_AMBTC|nr:uncharacterized protein LOC18445099 [Amborella trichopoda]ERN16774.1 hypothetical protein AMTR_s00057p00063220 [Amborella trichopoda]|eukprot:XP_006855307.3 uncharacterized protein LOC18445099 [Amborella trichopoda]